MTPVLMLTVALLQQTGTPAPPVSQAEGARAAARQAAEFARVVQEELQAQAPQGGQTRVFVQPGGGVVMGGRGTSPSAVHEAARQQRSELRDQLERLEDQRNDLVGELRSPELPEAARKGVEQRLANVDVRIADVERQLAESDALVAQTAAVPGAVVPPPPRPRDPGPPDEFYVLVGIFMFVVILPLTIAYARRIWRRGAAAVSTIPNEIYDRFHRLDQAIDAVAIEVERIGEGQRYLTRLHADERGLGAGPAARMESAEREPERQLRK